MKTELMLSWRYLLTKRKEKFISLISLISVLGIAIGVMALIVVLAVMSGFDKDLHDKIVGNQSHITLSGFEAISASEYTGLSSKVAANKHVKAISPFLQGQVLVKEGNKFFAVGLKGIDPIQEAKVTKINQYLILGGIDDLKQGGIIIGKELAAYLGLSLNSKLTLYSPFGKQYALKVTGIFSSGMYDYDLNLVFTDLKSAQLIFDLPDKITAIAIKLDNPDLASKVKEELGLVLGFNYILKTWEEANQNFFAALKLEKLVMFIILALIILVASFNIISTLIVMVVEKTKDIGILKALGLSSKGVRLIFTLQGLIIGTVGVLLGSLGGLVLCFLLKKYQFVKIPQDIYYIERLPVAIELWPDIFLIASVAMIIVLISTIYPAAKAAQLKPVEALRYE
ncbi:MAG: ABC transporter permease [Candidatus Omnitrophica bacterium]|nr:ABC transporter permease [Candidatus Omnitrophota bacterium]